jgi:hypothetical protein
LLIRLIIKARLQTNPSIDKNKWKFGCLVNKTVEVSNLLLNCDKTAEKDKLRFGRFVNQTNQKDEASN